MCPRFIVTPARTHPRADQLRVPDMRRLRPHRPQILAGTVPCPECQGHPLIRRHTANLEKAFNLEEPWQFSVRLHGEGPCTAHLRYRHALLPVPALSQSC